MSELPLTSQGPDARATRGTWFGRLLDVVYRGRQEILLVGVGIGVVEGLIEHEKPMGLFEPRARIAAAWALLLAGVALRAWALGTVRKKRELATRGPYSLCRNPLYLGTMLVYAAFCVWLNDDEFVYFGLVYFPVIYGLLVLREGRELQARFGEDFRAYARSTPVVLPIGRFRSGAYNWASARRGVLAMLVGVVVMLAAIHAQRVAFSNEHLGGGEPDDLRSMVGHRRPAPTSMHRE